MPKQVKRFIGTSILLGVGANVVERTGGNAAGVRTVSSFMPTVGAAIGGKLALDQVKKLQKRRRRR